MWVVFGCVVLNARPLAFHGDNAPQEVEDLLNAVGDRFPKVEDIKKLTADAGKFFPVEFEGADARTIRKSFMQEKRLLSGKI